MDIFNPDHINRRKNLEPKYDVVQNLLRFINIWQHILNTFKPKSERKNYSIDDQKEELFIRWIVRGDGGKKHPHITNKLYEMLFNFLKNYIPNELSKTSVNLKFYDIGRKIYFLNDMLQFEDFNPQFAEPIILKRDMMLWYFQKHKDKAKKAFFDSLSSGYFEFCTFLIEKKIVKITALSNDKGKSIFGVIADIIFDQCRRYDESICDAYGGKAAEKLVNAIFNYPEEDIKTLFSYENDYNFGKDGIKDLNDFHALVTSALLLNDSHPDNNVSSFFQNILLPMIPIDILVGVLKKKDQEGNVLLYALVKLYNQYLTKDGPNRYVYDIIRYIMNAMTSPKDFKEIMEVKNSDGKNILTLIAQGNDFKRNSDGIITEIHPQSLIMLIINHCFKFSNKNERFDEEGNIAVSILWSLLNTDRENDMTIWHRIIKCNDYDTAVRVLEIFEFEGKDGDLKNLLLQKCHGKLITRYVPDKPIKYTEHDPLERMKSLITQYFCKAGIPRELPPRLMIRPEVRDYIISPANNKDIASVSISSLKHHYAKTLHWCNKYPVFSGTILSVFAGAILIDDFAATVLEFSPWHVIIPSILIGLLASVVVVPTSRDLWTRYRSSTSSSGYHSIPKDQPSSEVEITPDVENQIYQDIEANSQSQQSEPGFSR